MKIREEVKAGRITIEPFDDDSVNPNSYNYHLSPQLKRLLSTTIDCRGDDVFETIVIPDSWAVLLPGECYLGSTVEWFSTDHYACLITGRSSIGRKFITNHITAGLIDQGFAGNITLEITVQRPTRVYASMPFGQILWFTTVGPSSLYDGKYREQRGATPSRLKKDWEDNQGDEQ